jgi:hypothetical protein
MKTETFPLHSIVKIKKTVYLLSKEIIEKYAMNIPKQVYSLRCCFSVLFP